MIKAYYYLFYKFYRFGELSPSSFPSDFTSTFAITVLETILIFSLNFFYIDFVNKDYVLTFNLQTIAPLVVVFIVNYLAFIRSDKWKDYNKEFEQLPTDVNNRGTAIVMGVVLVIITSMWYSIHVMSVITGIH